MHKSALTALRNRNGTLSPVLQTIASHVQANADRVLYQTIIELAESCRVSEASIIRLCRELGFKGFQEFKLALATDLAVRPVAVPSTSAPATTIEIADHVVREAQQVLIDTREMLDVAALDAVVDALATARRIHVFGVGASGATARDFVYKFVRLGLAAATHDDPHMAAMTASTLTPDDVVFGISRSGTTKDVVHVIEVAKERGARTIALTHRAKSAIAFAADLVLTVPAPESPLSGGAISSKIGQLITLDILFSALALRFETLARAVELTAASVADKNL